MRKLLIPFLIVLAALAAWFLIGGDEPLPGPSDGPAEIGTGEPVEPGTIGGTEPVQPAVGRSEVTESGAGAAARAVAKAAEIRGQVQQPDGSPLAGATVLLLRRSADAAMQLGQDHAASVDATLTTDAEGWYRVRGLAAGTAWSVWAWHEDYAFAEGPAVEGVAGFEQELPPIRMELGYVLDVTTVGLDGAPIAGARVELSLDGLPPMEGDEPDPLGRRFVTTSEADGYAGFEFLGAGAWVLRATKDGLGDGWMRPIVILPRREPQPIRLVLGPEFPVRGVVVSTGGGPVADAEVTLTAQPAEHGPAFRALTDSDGRFDIGGVPEGQFLLHASKRGFQESRPEPTGGTEAGEHRLELQPLGVVRGRLLGADGAVARGARLELWRTTRGQPPYFPTGESSPVTGDTGAFEVAFPGGGSWVLLATAEGCAPTWSAALQTRVDDIELGEWRLPGGARVTGVLGLGGSGPFVSEALLRLRPAGWDQASEFGPFVDLASGEALVAPLETRSDAKGAFTLGRVPPGEYVVSVEHPDAVTAIVPIAVQDGRDMDLGRVRLDAACALLIRASRPDGTPLAGGTVMISDSENAFSQRSRLLDAAGRARVAGLPSGDYWVVAVEGGGLFGKTSETVKVWLGNGEKKELEITLPD